MNPFSAIRLGFYLLAAASCMREHRILTTRQPGKSLVWHFRFPISWPLTQRFSWIMSLIISFPPQFLTISFLNYYFQLVSHLFFFPLKCYLFSFISLCLLFCFLWDFLKFPYHSCHYFIMLSYSKWYFQVSFVCFIFCLYYAGLSLQLQLKFFLLI